MATVTSTTTLWIPGCLNFFRLLCIRQRLFRYGEMFWKPRQQDCDRNNLNQKYWFSLFTVLNRNFVLFRNVEKKNFQNFALSWLIENTTVAFLKKKKKNSGKLQIMYNSVHFYVSFLLCVGFLKFSQNIDRKSNGIDVISLCSCKFLSYFDDLGRLPF